MQVAIIFYYHKKNKYSFNALAASIENEKEFNNIPIFFPENEKELMNDLNEAIKNYKIIIVGISFATPQLLEIKHLIKTIRKEFNHTIKLIAGGAHPSACPEETLKIGFDTVVIGEGEEIIKHLLHSIINNEDLKKVKGIAFIEDEAFIFTGRTHNICLDNYPPFSQKYNKFGPIEITRGCYYNCYFCQAPRLFGNKLRHRSIDTISKYVEIMKKNNLQDIRFISPNAFSYGSSKPKEINFSAIEVLLKNVRKILGSRGRIFFGTFPSEVRPEYINKDTIQLIQKYANNDNIVIGAQSGSQRILDLCHRQHSVSDIYNAVKITTDAGLKANVDFIFGLPNENKEDIKETAKLIEDLIRMGAKIHSHIFTPLPGTPFKNCSYGKIAKEIKTLLNKYIAKGLIWGHI